MKTALISLSDKTGIEILLEAFKKHNIRIISTGGTAKKIQKLGYSVTQVSEITGVDEYPGGLVKTLHPKIHFGILHDRKDEEHINRAKQENIDPIDFVVCNLYPFKKTISSNDVTKEKAIANIDIGGVAMIRAAAKNQKYVTVIVDPIDYEMIAKTLNSTDNIPEEIKQKLSAKAFLHTAKYDTTITSYFADEHFPKDLIITLKNKKRLRYGENSHQEGYFYQYDTQRPIPTLIQHQGKELSFNNLNDYDAVLKTLKDFNTYFPDKTAVIVSKHTNPCGIAVGDNLLETFENAWEGDSISAFGSVIATNKIIDEKTATFIKKRFIEVIFAKGFSDCALEILKKKKNLRLLTFDSYDNLMDDMDMDLKFLDIGVLAQSKDNRLYENLELRSGNINIQDHEELIRFGLASIKNIKSNAIILVRKKDACLELIGAGIGQPNRVIAVKLAIDKATENLKKENDDPIWIKKQFEDLWLISDAFFPFPDSVELAASFNIKNIIEPGGSIKDEEVIASAKKHGINLIFTGLRHFKH